MTDYTYQAISNSELSEQDEEITITIQNNNQYYVADDTFYNIIKNKILLLISSYNTIFESRFAKLALNVLKTMNYKSFILMILLVVIIETVFFNFALVNFSKKISEITKLDIVDIKEVLITCMYLVLMSMLDIISEIINYFFNNKKNIISVQFSRGIKERSFGILNNASRKFIVKDLKINELSKSLGNATWSYQQLVSLFVRALKLIIDSIGPLVILIYCDFIASISMIIISIIGYYLLVSKRLHEIVEENVEINKKSNKNYSKICDNTKLIPDAIIHGYEENLEEKIIGLEDINEGMWHINVSKYNKLEIFITIITALSTLIALIIFLLRASNYLLVISFYSSIQSIKNSIRSIIDIYENYLRLKSQFATLDEILDNAEKNFKEKAEQVKIKETLEINNVEIVLTAEKRTPYAVSFNDNISIKRGDVVLITGKSGNGKSTLCDIISNILIPKNADVFCDGIKLDKKFDNLSDSIAYVRQDYDSTLTFEPSILEIITGSTDTKNLELVDEILDIVMLKDFINKSFDGKIDIDLENNISGGQRMKLAFAKAIFNSINKQILILDEGDKGLPEKEASIIIQKFIKKFNGIVFMISHIKSLQLMPCINKRIHAENGILKVESNINCSDNGHYICSCCKDPLHEYECLYCNERNTYIRCSKCNDF
jgi:ABC-type multidrug transport system fused ATPase/permease subunit